MDTPSDTAPTPAPAPDEAAVAAETSSPAVPPEPAPEPAPAPVLENNIQIDAANVLHDAERDTRHGLSHIEDEFLQEWHKLFTGMEDTAKRLLAWVASKL